MVLISYGKNTCMLLDIKILLSYMSQIYECF